MDYPTKDRYFLEIYLGPDEANIIKVLDETEECEPILRSKAILKNFCEHEKTFEIPKKPDITINGIDFYYLEERSPCPLNPVNEDCRIWIRRPLTKKEMIMISPFLI